MKIHPQYWLSIKLFLFLAIISFETRAQLSENGIPESFKLSLKNAAKIPILQLDSVHVQKMLEEDNKFRIDNRYGVIQQCLIDIKQSGIKTNIPGKGAIWQYKIESRDGLSLGLFFKTFNLPEGATVFIYDESKSNLRGAFTKRNNSLGHQLPIAEFQGNNLIIEYFEPSSPDFSGELVLGSVSQAYIDLQSADTTRIGINCPLGGDWQEIKSSVCMMTFNNTRYSYSCTGSLINNTREDETPYFLTANHCISTEAEANTLVTYFNYENSTCTLSDASKNLTLAGATFKSGNSFSDFSLLLLNEYPGTEYKPFFAGWNAIGTNPLSGVCIHHPNATPKCIAIDENTIESYAAKSEWRDDGGNLISTTLSNTHWRVIFDQGNVEAGSSGSPLFDENKRVVGQLHGGTTLSKFGKFSLSWNHFSENTKQLKYWLDPDNTGAKIIDGIGQKPPHANFIAELHEVCVNTAVLFSNKSKDGPTQLLWRIQPSSYSFVNGTDSSSRNPQIIFQNEGAYSVALKAMNKYGSDVKTIPNYILAKSKLDVKFLQASADSVICGCNFIAFPLIADGAFNYAFRVSETGLIDTKSSSDTLFLSLNKSAIGGSSFDTWVKVTGTHGLCTASDSILLHIIFPPNNNIANAAKLTLGRNIGYSNQCATVQINEPYPASSGCLVSNNWCPDQTANGSILNNSIWFTFNSPSNGLVNIITSGFDDQIAVYDADSPGSKFFGSSTKYTLVAANDDHSVRDNTAQIENLSLDPGKQYWLQVDGNNAAYGNLTIDLVSNSIEVYPNPSSGIYYLTISNPDGLADVSVYDLQGQKLFDTQYATSFISNKFSLDLSGFANGMYLLNVRMNGSNLSKKLIRR